MEAWPPRRVSNYGSKFAHVFTEVPHVIPFYEFTGKSWITHVIPQSRTFDGKAVQELEGELEALTVEIGKQYAMEATV